jgi:hypothetical protein
MAPQTSNNVTIRFSRARNNGNGKNINVFQVGKMETEINGKMMIKRTS